MQILKKQVMLVTNKRMILILNDIKAIHVQCIYTYVFITYRKIKTATDEPQYKKTRNDSCHGAIFWK